MNRFQCTCKYCGHVWISYYFTKPRPGIIKCDRCESVDIKVRDAKVCDVFGYGETDDDTLDDIVEDSD